MSVKTGWLKDHNGDKFAPKTYASQVVDVNGTSIEDVVNENINSLRSDLDEVIDQMNNNLVNTVTLSTSAWSSSAPYTQTITISGMTADDSPTITYNLENVTTLTDKKAIQKAWNMVDDVETATNSIIVTCKFEKPTVDIPLVIKQ